MAEKLREQVDNSVRNLVIPRTDPRDTFDYGAFDVSTTAVRQVFPWLEPLIGDVLYADPLARVVLHSAESREEVIKRGVWPFRSEDKRVVPGYRTVDIILPKTEEVSGGISLSWRLGEGEEGRFFLKSAQFPVTEGQLHGLSTLLQDHLKKIEPI